MFKGQLLFGDCSLTNRLTWSDCKNPHVSLTFSFSVLTSFFFTIDIFTMDIVIALLVEQLKNVLLYFYMQTIAIMKITFWAEEMKITTITTKPHIQSWSPKGSISIVLKIYGNIFRLLLIVFKNKVFYYRICVNFNIFLPILFFWK